SLARAASIVDRARTRLLRAAVLDGAARGALGGAIAGVTVSLLAHLAGAPPVALVTLPFAGAAVGAVWVLLRPPTTVAAALALDRAADTDEAFVSALTATDAAPWVLEFTAARAVESCDESSVARFLLVPAPAAGAAAAVLTVLLAAIVLVPAAQGDGALGSEAGASAVTPRPGVAGAGGTTTSPSSRALAFAESVRAGTDADALTAASRPEATVVRADLAAVPEPDLQRLAEALASKGAAEGKRALDALARGDRGAAIDALRAALGVRDADAGGVPAGGRAAGSVPGGATDVTRRLDPWSGASWPLRYDRAVRRYLEDTK
ncbi:MAG: hypothetical protein K8T90_04155, partial [Planctomycetes bacterium]|nr:hypothetical protein [Planctomycetota bacterium]